MLDAELEDGEDADFVSEADDVGGFDGEAGEFSWVDIGGVGAWSASVFPTLDAEDAHPANNIDKARAESIPFIFSPDLFLIFQQESNYNCFSIVVHSSQSSPS